MIVTSNRGPDERLATFADPLRAQPRHARVKKLVLRNFQSPGDLLMLTAAVRDLHVCYPGRFLTDVRISCPDLWLHNPYLTPLREDDPTVEVVDCHYPLIDRINDAPYHFLHGFVEHLNDVLGLEIRPTQFREARKIIFDPPRIVEYRAGVDELSSYFLTLMSVPGLCETMEQRLRAHVVKELDYRVVARKFVQIVGDKLGIK